MAEKSALDLLIKNVRIVRPNQQGVSDKDIGIIDGKFVRIEAGISHEDAKEVVDGKNYFAFPGLVDAHMHVGIYNPLEEDAVTESQAAAMGGVTSTLTYFRTGQYYLNKGGSYKDFYPEVLQISAGNYYVDYGYHLAPISGGHIDEMELLATEFGVPSFKIFMFYGGYGLHGRSDAQNQFLMIGEDERYDFAHFEFVMRGAKRVIDSHPELKDYISVSLHCEVADILTAYSKIVIDDGKLDGLAAYSAARPPHSEGLAIWIAAYLAHETECPNINLLHLSSRKAVEAALMMQDVFPHINFCREVTIGHLMLDIDAPTKLLAKVNPPIRPREDVEFLWKNVLEGNISWIVSDHACCSTELKLNAEEPDNLWLAKAGFGGTEYLLSGVFSEGRKRGMPYNQIAELLSWNPAQRYGLLDKGDIAVGYDADLVLLNPDESFVVGADNSLSAQGYSPMEGIELTGKVKSTFVRGNLVYHNGEILGEPIGQYMKRPYGTKR